MIGLDRTVVWHSDPAALAALESAAAAPAPSSRLVSAFGHPLVADLLRRGWLQEPAELCREYLLRTAQIEVTAHCNWGCRYCPVSVDPKPRETMPMDLFTEIVAKLEPYDEIKYVTFHFFNEPTLDRHFKERVKVLQEYGRKLSLATNASALTPDKIEALQDSGVVHHLVVNLPALDEAEFRTLTGADTYRQSFANLETAIAAGWPITLAVNGTGHDGARNAAELKARYEPRGVEVLAPLTCDRAGTLDGEYHQAVRVEGRLRGCSWPVNHAYFSVRGDLFICCNDYYQRETFGNIRGRTVDDLMTGPDAVRARRRVFGVEQAPDDYLCRSCHDQLPDFGHRQFFPLASFPVRTSR